MFRGAGGRSAALREVLQMAFAAELLAPGDEVCIAVPRIGDAVVLDNRGGGFDMLDPGWGRREVRLAEILVALLARGTRVRLAAPPDPRNAPFLARLREAAAAAGCDGLLELRDAAALDAPGILTTRGALLGSIDLTEDDIRPNDEVVEFDASPDGITAARRVLGARWEGAP